MSDKDGGPAFPGIDGQDGYGHMTRTIQPDGMAANVLHNQGMTLWDYYARGAIEGLNANPRDDVATVKPMQRAEYAAEEADAMIAERRKRGIGQ